MSLPSDTTPDVMDAMEEMATNAASRGARSQLTPEQRGLIIAALVAFLGISYLGPALTRFRRAPTLKERVARRLHETRRRAEKAGGRARQRVRQLGGGRISR